MIDAEIVIRVPGWLRHCMRDDAAQLVATAEWLQGQVAELVRIHAGDRRRTRRARVRETSGYRSSRDQHRVARAKVSPERRQEIARMGAAARAAKRRAS